MSPFPDLTVILVYFLGNDQTKQICSDEGDLVRTSYRSLMNGSELVVIYIYLYRYSEIIEKMKKNKKTKQDLKS